MHISAFAKLTTSLRITSVRDDGFHELDAEMVSLAFRDEIEIDEGDSLNVVGSGAEGVPTDDTNLIRVTLARAGRTAAVTVNKNIPTGGGLGGASANAAAILRWAGSGDDLGLAAQIGADVPFCLHGGCARVRGVGEVLEPLAYSRTTYTLFIPELAVSTPRVYGEWDNLGGPVGDNGNDLEPAVLSAYPEMKAVREVIGEAVGQQPRLAGSGATWFVEGPVAVAIDDVTVVVTETVDRYE